MEEARLVSDPEPDPLPASLPLLHALLGVSAELFDLMRIEAVVPDDAEGKEVFSFFGDDDDEAVVGLATAG